MTLKIVVAAKVERIARNVRIDTIRRVLFGEFTFLARRTAVGTTKTGRQWKMNRSSLWGRKDMIQTKATNGAHSFAILVLTTNPIMEKGRQRSSAFGKALLIYQCHGLTPHSELLCSTQLK